MIPLLLGISNAYATSLATLHLDVVGGGVKEGQDIIFSGKLTTPNGVALSNRTIFVLDDTMYTRPDIILAIAETDSDGKFSTSWEAIPKDNGTPFHFYAKFLGEKSFGYTRSETYESYLEKSDQPSADVMPWKTVPPWFKNASKMWHDGQIRDVDYSYAIQNLIDYGIIKTNNHVTPELKIPSWVKTDAMWLSTGQISTDDYTNVLSYLLENNMISTP